MLAAVAVLLAVSGGVRATVGGLRISARSPLPAAVMTLVTLGGWWWLARRAASVTADLDAVWMAIERHATPAILCVAVASGAVAAAFATNSASGADASGYLSQAMLWEQNRFFLLDELSNSGAVETVLTTPLGWRPTFYPGMQAPTYPPGLPWLMAMVPGTSYSGVVVVIAAAVAVWTTGLIATRLAGRAAGSIAAILIATSPVFLFQSVQPMSDVPVTAAWMLTWLLLIPRDDKHSGLPFDAGLVCALAVLIRPNLAPLAALPLWAIGWNVRRLAAFSLPVVFAAALLMFLQNMWYGSPLRSGYGTADELFALSNIGDNAARYSWWLMTTAPVLLLAPVGIALLWRRPFAKPLAAFGALVVAAYLVYAVFDVWSYLRFLLPAMAVAAVFAAAATVSALRRLPTPLRGAAALAVMLVIFGHGVSQARARDTFRLADQQRRVAQVAEFIATALPADTVIIAGEQSGSLSYYTGKSILRWDIASAESLAAALTVLGASGRPVVVALDAWEREPFRSKFGVVDSVSLEWPPALEAGTSHRTLVWRLSDRDAFLRGQRIATERVP
ncbi:MAG: ArnT family glycosyltransferase [Vicinamibacterales bacterium]